MLRVRYIILFSLFILLKSISSAFSQERICEIKFNEKKGATELEKQMNKKFNYQYSKEINAYYCYKIGLEYDKQKKPIKENPIYACCKNL